MRKLISRLVFPLTFLSYVIFDKWWYVDVADGPDIIVHGFPIISNAPSLASSMEKVYFIPETLINITLHFIFWLLMVFILKLWMRHIRIPSIVAKISGGIILLSIAFFIYFSITFNTDFSWENDLDTSVKASGFEWSWQNSPTPDYNKYHPLLQKAGTSP